MNWKNLTSQEYKLCRDMVIWMGLRSKYRTVDILPTDADIIKSVLFERLRRGESPLEFPPPLKHSYPWYDIVESNEPLYIGFANIPTDIRFNEKENKISFYQHTYSIEEKITNAEYTIKDGYYDTPYRFKLWCDVDDTWFVINRTFSKIEKPE